MTIHIPSLAPEVVAYIQGWPITNTMVNAWLAIIIFLVVGLAIRWSVKLRPNKLQNFFEHILDLVMGYFDQVTGTRAKTVRAMPIVGAVFFFILLSNWLGLLPGTGSIMVGQEFLLRPANTDLNLTLAMAITAVVASHIFGFFAVGVAAHLGKFIQIKNFFKSFKHGPIGVFQAIVEGAVGLIEIVSEAAKVVSLSLRLFGNIFAGEVLISVISALVGLLVPTPFMLLELLVGLIQAAVFAMLTLVYVTVASLEPHGAEEH